MDFGLSPAERSFTCIAAAAAGGESPETREVISCRRGSGPPAGL